MKIYKRNLTLQKIKYIGVTNYGLYNTPSYYLILREGRKKRYFRQVFYNPHSDYGYWTWKDALNYTSYLNTKGNIEEWKPDRYNLKLYYDPNAPDYWKDWKRNYNYMLFEEESKVDLEQFLKLFALGKNKMGKLIQGTIELYDVSYLIELYNKRRMKQIERWRKEREKQRRLEEERKYKEWEEEKRMMEEKWQFRSKSNPNKVYTVKWKKYNDEIVLSCDCPTWIYNRRKNRTCKHTDMVREMLNRKVIIK